MRLHAIPREDEAPPHPLRGRHASASIHAPESPREDAAYTSVAPWPHTLALFAVLLLTAALGSLRAGAVAGQMPRLQRYLSSMLLEWLLLGSVVAGLYHRRAFLARALLSRQRPLARSLAQGLAVYVAGLLALALVGSALYFTPLRARTNQDVVLAMLPHTTLQFLLWFLVSLTAGVCEEVIFRGYLQRQITAWTGRPILSIVLAALVFGSVHLYEGLGAILPLAALAVVYGLAVHRVRGDLRAAIVAHTLQDFLVAVLALARPFLQHYQPPH